MYKKKKLIWYHPGLVEQAKELRNNCNEAEKLLWQRLKRKQIRGYDFHRQKPLVYYIVDFYCTPLRLAIEIDGEIHNNDEIKHRDQFRQELLEDYGISVLRFSNRDVQERMDWVVECIVGWIDENENGRE
jgi:very-short-patch-repair endonuclease